MDKGTKSENQTLPSQCSTEEKLRISSFALCVLDGVGLFWRFQQEMKRVNSQIIRDSFARLPSIATKSKTVVKSRKINDIHLEKPTKETSLISYFFPDLPEHYPLRKKIAISKSNSTIGSLWDLFLLFLSLVACAFYITDTYGIPYESVKYFQLVEILITQFFLIDFLLNWYLAGTYSFLYRPMSVVDIITILPLYLTFFTHLKKMKLGFFRFARILRLSRIFRTFKAIKKISGVKKQILTLSLTFLSMSFLAAGYLSVTVSLSVSLSLSLCLSLSVSVSLSLSLLTSLCLSVSLSRS
jgi:hypothetical protein